MGMVQQPQEGVSWRKLMQNFDIKGGRAVNW